MLSHLRSSVITLICLLFVCCLFVCLFDESFKLICKGAAAGSGVDVITFEEQRYNFDDISQSES